ncbi:MAG: 3,4-dioxygenase subunit beta [Actinobacteria bacterium]|nr:3,4-dioxygenase subunit beta [Actinomycetota bacterium]
MTQSADHNDEHDQGLLYDLSTMRHPSRLHVDRRNALRLVGVAGAGLVLVACGKDGKRASSTTSTPEFTPTTAAGSATTVSASSAPAVPEETAGPFPGDGSNGPNVLNQSGIVRSDIRSSFGSSSGTADGVPLTVKLTVINTKTKAPYTGAAIYLWHCDAEGGYSLYSPGVTKQNYLRGVQAADSNGLITFKTTYPAAYPGRWPHMHFEVFPSLAEATKSGATLVMSQIALVESTNNEVYASDPIYSGSVQNMRRTSLSNDGVFRDGAELETPTMTGDLASGLTLNFNVGV